MTESASPRSRRWVRQNDDLEFDRLSFFTGLFAISAALVSGTEAELVLDRRKPADFDTSFS